MDYRKDEIIKKAKYIVSNLINKHTIKEAYIFGSFSKDNTSKHSDIDIAIVLDKIRDGSPFNEAFEIFHEIQKENSLFEAICFSEKEFNSGDAEVIKHIKRDGIKIY